MLQYYHSFFFFFFFFFFLSFFLLHFIAWIPASFIDLVVSDQMCHWVTANFCICSVLTSAVALPL